MKLQIISWSLRCLYALDKMVTGVEIFCEGMVCKFAPLAQNEEWGHAYKW